MTGVVQEGSFMEGGDVVSDFEFSGDSDVVEGGAEGVLEELRRVEKGIEEEQHVVGVSWEAHQQGSRRQHPRHQHRHHIRLHHLQKNTPHSTRNRYRDRSLQPRRRLVSAHPHTSNIHN